MRLAQVADSLKFSSRRSERKSI